VVSATSRLKWLKASDIGALDVCLLVGTSYPPKFACESAGTISRSEVILILIDGCKTPNLAVLLTTHSSIDLSSHLNRSKRSGVTVVTVKRRLAWIVQSRNVIEVCGGPCTCLLIHNCGLSEPQPSPSPQIKPAALVSVT